MSPDGLVFICIVLAGVLVIGVCWQAMNAWLDRCAELDRRRRADARARRYDRLAERQER